MQPAVGVGGLAALDGEQRLAQLRVIGPGSPAPTVQSARADLTEPTGVMTAAVPQAKTSVRVPSALPCFHSSVEIRRSSTA